MHVVYNMQEQMDNISNTNTRKSIPKYMIFKLQKTKDQEKILKEATDPGLGQGDLTFRRTRIRITVDLSLETTQEEIFKMWKEKSPTNLEFCIQRNYPLKTKEKYFLRQAKLRDFITSRPALHEMLREICQRKGR